MNAPRDALGLRLARTVHASLVRLCPLPFRARFERELAQTFAAICRAAHARGGNGALARAALRGLADVVFTAWRLRMDSATAHPDRRGSRTLLVLLLAMLLAAVTGWVDQNSEEVQLPALLVLLTAAVCSYLQPRAALVWWLLAGGSIPIALAVGEWIGHKHPYPGPNEPYSWLIAFVPALLGVVLGVVARRLLARQQRPAGA